MKARPRALVACAVAAIVAAWAALGFPESYSDWIFVRGVKAAVKSGAGELRLSELLPGDWELVCDSHGYDGPLYLKQYNRTYPPAAPSQDSVWGLIFISRDGSYVSAVASCRSSGVMLNVNGCAKRDSAVLRVQGASDRCARFDRKRPL